MPPRELPAYVVHGFETESPGSFKSDNARMRIYLLHGDRDAIKTHIDQTLNVPLRGAYSYHPALGDLVILMMGDNVVGSKADGWKTHGRVNETLASFWIPLHRRVKGSDSNERGLRMWIPHILVDNPISLVTGRELYGFPKALGRFTPPSGFEAADGSTGPIRVEGFGGQYSASAYAGWRPLLDVRPVRHIGRARSDDAWRTDLDEFAQDFPGPISLVRQWRTNSRIKHVFLKQFRDVAQQDRACYQAVVEAPMKTSNVKWRRLVHHLFHAWEVRVHHLDTHDLGRELGLPEVQRAHITYEMEFSFEVLPGDVIAPPPGAGSRSSAQRGARPR